MSCHVSVGVRDQEVYVLLDCTQTGEMPDAVGVALILTCDTTCKNSYVNRPILVVVSIGLG